jgi:hypothetical protein
VDALEDFVPRLALLTTAFATECMDCSDRLRGKPGLVAEVSTPPHLHIPDGV